MQTLPSQSETVGRMLVSTDGETIHRDFAFVQTVNGYWLAWYDGIATLLAPDNLLDTPYFWIEGAQNLAELIALVENGGFNEVEEFDGDSDSWHEATAGYGGHGHDSHCERGH